MKRLLKKPLPLLNAAMNAIYFKEGFKCQVSQLDIYEVGLNKYLARYRASGGSLGPLETDEVEVQFEWKQSIG